MVKEGRKKQKIMKTIYAYILAIAALIGASEASAQALFTQSNATLFIGSSSGTPQAPEASTPTLFVDGHTVNNGTLTNDGEVQFRGNLTNNGTFTANGDEVFNGTVLQTIAGNFTGANSFQNLLIDKPAQIIVDANTSIEIQNTGLLKFFNGGIVRMNSTHELRILNGAAAAVQGYPAPNATGSYVNDKYIIGRLGRAINVSGTVRDFPVGDHFTTGEGYNPMVLSLQSISAPDVIVALFQKGTPGSINTGGPIPLGCGTPATAEYTAFTGEGYWEINQKGSSTVNYDVSMHSNSNNTNSAPVADYYRTLRHSSVGGAWSLSTVTDGDECAVTSNYYLVPGNGYSGFSFFAIAPNVPSVVTWLGGGTTDWHTGSNWSSGTVPSCGTTISIPAGNTPYPVVNTPASCGNIILGNAVTIQLNTDLQVCGNWVGNSIASVVSGNGFVVFNGSATQTFSGNTQFNFVRLNNANGLNLQASSFFDVFTQIDLQTGNINVTSGQLRLLSTSTTHCAIVNDFSPLTYNGTLSGNIVAQRFIGGIGNIQHQIGVPLSSIAFTQIGASGTAGNVIPTANCDETQSAGNSPYGNVFQWNETTPTSCILQGWEVKVGGNTQNARGYSVYLNGGSTLNVTGMANLDFSYVTPLLTNSSYNLPTLQSSPNYSFESGWHLVSNPFPSGYAFTLPPGFDDAAMFVPTGPYSGTYTSIALGTTNLAPFQAFIIHVPAGGGTSTLTFQRANRTTHPSIVFYQQNGTEILNVQLTGNGFMDKTRIEFHANATTGFDIAMDSRKQRSNLGQPTLYTGYNVFPHSSMVNKSVIETATVPLGILPGANGTFTLNFNGVNSFDPTTYIYLEDKHTGTYMNMRSNNAYTFNMNTGENVNRFEVHFTPPALFTVANAACGGNGMLSAEQPGQAEWQYTVENSNAVVMGSGSINASNPLAMSLPADVYTVILTDSQGYQVVKNFQVHGTTPIIATGSSSKQEAEVGEPIVFSCTNTDAVSVEWNLGDGTIQLLPVIAHQYLQDGIYTIALTVTNSDSCVDTKTIEVLITPQIISLLNAQPFTEDISIYSVYEKVYVNLLAIEDADATIEIYNALGQQLVRKEHVKASLFTESLQNVLAAHVLVRVTNSGQVTSKPLFIISE